MTRRITLFLFFLWAVNLTGVGQVDTVFLKSFGAAFYEDATEIISRADGGYTVVGTTGSNETGSTDVFVASFDEDLNCMWSRNYGSADVDWGMSIVEDLSGNFIVCGYTLSTNGSYDMLVIKINATGDLMWQQTFGGADWDFAKKISTHPLGGYLICGSTYSGGNGDQDGVVLHIDGQGLLLNQWYLLGNVMWERILEDTNGYDREVSALTTSNGQLFATGPVYTALGMKSFELRIPLDNSTAFEVVEIQDFEFIYRDCAAVNDKIVFVGSKITNGIELGRVVRKHSELYFTGVFEFTGQNRAKFNSVIWHGDALVMCGAFKASSTENWQALILKYTSPIMNEVNVEPELAPCFSVEVEETNMPVEGDMGVLYTLTGQIVDSSFEWNHNSNQCGLASGLYLFRAEGKRTFAFWVD